MSIKRQNVFLAKGLASTELTKVAFEQLSPGYADAVDAGEIPLREADQKVPEHGREMERLLPKIITRIYNAPDEVALFEIVRDEVQKTFGFKKKGKTIEGALLRTFLDNFSAELCKLEPDYAAVVKKSALPYFNKRMELQPLHDGTMGMALNAAEHALGETATRHTREMGAHSTDAVAGACANIAIVWQHLGSQDHVHDGIIAKLSGIEESYSLARAVKEELRKAASMSDKAVGRLLTCYLKAFSDEVGKQEPYFRLQMKGADFQR